MLLLADGLFETQKYNKRALSVSIENTPGSLHVAIQLIYSSAQAVIQWSRFETIKPSSHLLACIGGERGYEASYLHLGHHSQQL